MLKQSQISRRTITSIHTAENKNEKSEEKKPLIDFHKEQHNSLYCLLNRHQTKQRQKKATQKNEHNKQTESSELMGAIELMSAALKILK